MTTAVKAVYDHLSTLRDKTQFTSKYVRRALPGHTSAAIGNALYRMSSQGAIGKVSTGEYVMYADKLASWGKGRDFMGQYKTTPGARANKSKPVEATSKPGGITSGDIEVLGGLLDAMVKAEPVIKKYQQIAEVLKDSRIAEVLKDL